MLTAKLTLDRLDKDYRLLERREQQSRSFTRGFLELLYVSHAQIQAGAPYTMTDIRGCDALDVDNQVATPHWHHKGSKGNLALGSPPGSSQKLLTAGWSSAGVVYMYLDQQTLMGEHLGIQLGGGATAVTPTDRFIETRFGHGIRPADGGNVTFESYTTGEDANREIYGDQWSAQSFRAQHHHKLYSVKIKAYREGSPGEVTVDIHAGRWTDNDMFPKGSALVTGTFDGDTLTDDPGGEWKEVTFPSQIEIVPGMDYVIVVHCGGDISNSLHWLYDTSSAEYHRGILLTSPNGGAGWVNVSGDDCMFEEIGRSSGELQYGGCELVDLAFSDPNGEFTIRRFFTNKSGESRTVNEVGIYAAGSWYALDDANIYSFCIAHDIVAPGVAVADGELLRVTYVPQITV